LFHYTHTPLIPEQDERTGRWQQTSNWKLVLRIRTASSRGCLQARI